MEPALRLIQGDAHQWSEQTRSCPIIPMGTFYGGLTRRVKGAENRGYGRQSLRDASRTRPRPIIWGDSGYPTKLTEPRSGLVGGDGSSVSSLLTRRSCLAGQHGPGDFAFLDKASGRVQSVGHDALRVKLARDGRRAVTLT